MKRTLAILIVLVALCMALGSGAALASDNPAVSILQRSVETMGQLSSVAVEGTLTIGIEGLLNTAVYDAFSAKLFMDPLKGHMLFQAMGVKFEAYFEELDGTLYLYEQSGSRWHAQTLDVDLSAATELEPAELVAFLDSIEGLGIEGTEQIGGKEAWKMSAAINLREFVGQEEIEEAVGQVMGVPAMGIFPPYEPVPARIYAFVEGDTGHLLRMEIDLSQFASDMLTRLTPTQPGMTSAALVAEVKIALDFMDFDAVPDFEIPPEAKMQSEARVQ